MRTRAKFKFVEFIRPDYYWPQPYTLEQAFGVLQWMVRTGAAFEFHTRYGMQGPIELLSCAPSCTNFQNVRWIDSIHDLKNRFHFAMFSRPDRRGVDYWREEYGISPMRERFITFPHHKPFTGGAGWESEADVHRAFKKLLQDGKLAVTNKGASLNTVHPKARQCFKIQIAVTTEHFRFMLCYGFPGEKTGCHWWHELARTDDPSEPFLVTMRRAADHLAEIAYVPPQPEETRHEDA